LNAREGAVLDRFFAARMFAVCIALSTAAVASAQMQGSGAGGSPNYLRQTTFTIPFQIGQAAGETTEVRLFTSTDFGRTWQLAGRAAPNQEKFDFRAPADGMYWFSLRTVDRMGRLQPNAPHSPGLQVVVDTLAPKIDFTVESGADRDQLLRWQADDPNLDASTLKVRYQVAGAEWQDFAVRAEPATDARGRIVGLTRWMPPQGVSGQVVLHAEIADAAGNVASATRTIEVRGDAVADRRGGMSSTDASAIAPTDRDRQARTENSAQSQPWPVDRNSETPLDRSLAENRVADAPRPSAVAPPVAGRSGAEETTADGAAKSWPLPPGETAHMIASRSLRLRYDVQNVGASGVAKVELWQTTDGGKTWRLDATDDDLQSPITAQAPGEGLYGYRIRIENRLGQGGVRPASGDLPEIWVGVDLTRPQAAVTQALPGADAEGSYLDVRWNASDARLADRPISIYFSEQPAGPWSTVAASLVDTGEYRWRLPQRMPEQVFLRLEVRDTAGNLGVFQTGQPIALRAAGPQGRIQGIDAADPTAVRPLDYQRR
jgi:hypothetical protein